MFEATSKDNPIFSADDEGYIHYIEYGPKEREIREPSSNDSSSQTISKMAYCRSSSSSSSNASSGKQLVRTNPSHSAALCKGRLEDTTCQHHKPKREVPLHNPPPGIKKPTTPKFFIGPPSSCSSSRRYPDSATPSPDIKSKRQNERTIQSNVIMPRHYSHFPLPLHRDMLALDKNGKLTSIYDAYWHIPRPSLWCTHNHYKDCDNENQICAKCQPQEETSSTCSSTNPPPTFTAMDNYLPVKPKKRRCSCGAVSLATTAFSTFVLILIAAFILYIEMVIRRNEYVPDPM